MAFRAVGKFNFTNLGILMTRILSVALLPLLLGGCATTSPPEVLAFRSPLDVTNSVRKLHHHSVISNYNHRDPVDPKPWRQLNDDRAPQAEESAPSEVETPS